MKIAIRNLQRTHRLNRPRLAEFLRLLMARVHHAQPARTWNDFTLVLTDDAGILELNRSVLGHAYATDVISFGLPPIPGEPGGAYTAEVVVNVERAWDQGQIRRRWTPSLELALYIAHGCNHLTGWNDDTPTAAARMRRREQRWLRTLAPTGGFLLFSLDAESSKRV